MINFFVSVIIPTYNRKNRLIKTINSVLAQDYKNYEIIIIDDGSTDGTANFIKEIFPQVVLLEQENQGVSAARNLGIKAAQGNWIAFLDSDDLWHSNKLSQQINHLKKNPQYHICHSEEIWIKNGIRINPKKKHQKVAGNIYHKSIELCFISMSTVILKKEIFTKIGLFDINLPACEDYDLWLRITALYPILFANEYLITKFGGHPDQLSQKFWGMDRFRIMALEKILASKALNKGQELITKNILKKKINIYIKGAKKRNKNAEIQLYQEKLVQCI
jgi:glycosyltransferase involved in cell wall biosynthesis